MKKFDDKPYALLARPESVFHRQMAHKIVSHGKVCPWCKKSMIIYEYSVLVYRISVPRKMDQRYPAKVYFNKLNWDYVCSSECATEMNLKWRSALIPVQELAKKILAQPATKAISLRKGDGFREQTLAQAGIDPRMTTMQVVNPVLFPLPLWTVDLTT